MNRNALLIVLGAALGGLALYWFSRERRPSALASGIEGETPLDERPTEVRAQEGDPHAMLMQAGEDESAPPVGRSRH